MVKTHTYQQRPIQIEAFQWRKTMGEVECQFGAVKSTGRDTNFNTEHFVFVDLTGHGWVITDKDWVVDGKYKLNDDLFNATYMRIVEPNYTKSEKSA